MALTPGTRLGPYEILAPLGAGGMGEVYRAHDTKLNRAVALKVLPTEFALDAERLARFKREAQVLASLNHPHIGAIYGFEESSGVQGLVLELVEGPTLADRIAQGALPIDEALLIAKQITEALETAHEQGIVHRDLKPANIKLRPDGAVKVLDFGLAKLDAAESDGPNASGRPAALTHSPTLTFAATQAGVILGTAAYMSPEQARGRPADKRSDVWAFGCVLYEMLTGRRVFDGEDVTDIIAAVVRADPDWAALPPETSPALRWVLEGCLQKDRQQRIPDMSVVRYLMSDAERPVAVASPPAPAASTRRPVVVGAVAAFVAGAAAAIVAWQAVRTPSATARSARFRLALPSSELPVAGGPDRTVVISPDGTHIVSVAGNGPVVGGGGTLVVRDIRQLNAMPLPGVGSVRSPFVSPDSKWIGYFVGGELRKVAMAGGPSIAICRCVVGGTRGSSWGADDTIVFASNDASTGLWSVPASGGESKLLTKPDNSREEVDHVFPSFLPTRRAVLFTILKTGSNDSADIAVLDLDTGQHKTVIRGGTMAEYMPVSTLGRNAGLILYAYGGSLRGVRFDAEALQTIGDPVVVIEQLRKEATGAAQFSVSREGSLVYAIGGEGNFENRSLVWVDRQGREQPVNAPSRAYAYPRISPDGSKVALAISDQEQDIWVLDFAHSTLDRLTFGPSVETNPAWSADGRRVLFSSSRGGIPNVYSQSIDHSGSAEQLTKSQTMVVPYAATPDGKSAVVSIGGGADIATIKVDGPSEPTPIIVGPGNQSNAEVSPDGRWIAYQSNESGQLQVYVRPFPDVNAGRWQVTTASGGQPVWAHNGRELFYLASSAGRDTAMMSVPIETTPAFRYGNSTKLFDFRYATAVPLRTFDVSNDGQRFLIVKDAEGERATGQPVSVVVVLNWLEEIRDRLSANK